MYREGQQTASSVWMDFNFSITHGLSLPPANPTIPTSAIINPHPPVPRNTARGCLAAHPLFDHTARDNARRLERRCIPRGCFLASPYVPACWETSWSRAFFEPSTRALLRLKSQFQAKQVLIKRPRRQTNTHSTPTDSQPFLKLASYTYFSALTATRQLFNRGAMPPAASWVPEAFSSPSVTTSPHVETRKEL